MWLFCRQQVDTREVSLTAKQPTPNKAAAVLTLRALRSKQEMAKTLHQPPSPLTHSSPYVYLYHDQISFISLHCTLEDAQIL